MRLSARGDGFPPAADDEEPVSTTHADADIIQQNHIAFI
jgi:hypothetical protein